MLSPEELADLRADFEALLDLDADIQRNPNIGNPVKGSISDEWHSILPVDTPTVKCGMMQPNKAQAQQYANLIGALQATVFSFADGQDAKRQDRVIVLSTTWTVQALLSPQSHSVATQVLATRLV